MSTIKISQLAPLPSIAANTSNTLFLGVDIPSGITGKFTATILSQQLFANNILNVGTNQQNLPNTIAQFSLNGESYIQTNLVNTNDGGSADIVVTANVGSGGSDSTNFIDMGWVNKNYQPGSEYNNIGTAVRPNDGYLYTQGTAGQPYGNLIIGTTSSNAQIKFIAGGGQSANIVARMTSTGLVLNTQSFITFSDGTVQTTAGSSVANTVYLQNGLNTANANISYLFGVNLAQNTNIQSAWNTANTALQNTSGTFAGSLTVTGNIISLSGSVSTTSLTSNGTSNLIGNVVISGITTMLGFVSMNNSTFSSNTAMVRITGSNNFSVVQPSNSYYMLQITGRANSATRLVMDSFGQNTYPVYVGRMARGSADNPQPSQNNDVLLRVVGNGWTGTQFASSSPTKIDFVASENFSDTNRGTAIQFWNTSNGSNTIQKIATFNADSVSFSGYVIPQKGFVYTPLVYPSVQTAITIDVANNSLVRAQTATGLAVTLSNLTAGKEVVAWITNTAGTNQTFTHGISATNSTTNSTTYAIPGTSTILARYMSIDGTLQNTFVAVTHA